MPNAGDPYGNLRYSASGDLSESVVENRVFSSHEPMGSSYFPLRHNEKGAGVS